MMTPNQTKELEQTAKQARALIERGLSMVDNMNIILKVHRQDLAKQVTDARHDLATPLSVIFNAATIAGIKGKKEEAVNNG